MRIKAHTTTMTEVNGTIDKHEILAFIRQTFQVPEGAVIVFTGDCAGLDAIEFGLAWSQTNKPLPEQDMPARVMALTTAEPGASGMRT